jgi:hypothetical protein
LSGSDDFGKSRSLPGHSDSGGDYQGRSLRKDEEEEVGRSLGQVDDELKTVTERTEQSGYSTTFPMMGMGFAEVSVKEG